MTHTLGIDPGPTKTAMVLWNGTHVVWSDIVPSPSVIHRIGTINVGFGTGLTVACEHLQCFGMAVGAEVFTTAYLIGSIQEYCRANGIAFRPVYRSEEKMHLCQSMRAKDGNIRQALIDRFGEVGTKKNPGPLFGIKADLWSALAVAVTFSETKQTEAA